MLNIVVLAAGQGKRMHSNLPKVLHPVAGKPMAAHVLDTARGLKAARLVVVHGHGGEVVQAALDAPDLHWALQSEQLGTGHALAQALALLAPDAEHTLVLYGDVPLIQPTTLERLIHGAGSGVGLLTVHLPNPGGYGRIVRDPEGAIARIVEEKDASAEERLITEINTGIMVLPTRRLGQWLARLSPANAQGEYYLTDVIAMAVTDGVPVRGLHPEHPWEVQGVNDKLQLAGVERQWQQHQAETLLRSGVRLADPARIDIRGELQCGRDVAVDVGCIFEGRVSLAEGVQVGPYCLLRNVSVGAGTRIAAYSHLEDCQVGPDGVIGPYARLRPGTRLGPKVHVGNFVEIKNSILEEGSKANHLAYVGDADVGARVNIGAGTITCNYDGVNKHRTVIEDDAFIGSDTQLVAPVRVGRGATLGAGTTLTKDAPPDTLTVSRARQVSLPAWKRPTKKA